MTSAAADACATAQTTQHTLSSDLFLPADGFRDTALGISVLMKRTMSAARARLARHFKPPRMCNYFYSPSPCPLILRRRHVCHELVGR